MIQQMTDSGRISCVLQNQEYASSSEFTGSIGLVSCVPVKKKKEEEGGNSVSQRDLWLWLSWLETEL
jgi:hypothetical protein